MSDFLFRGLINDANIRFAYACTTAVANYAVKSHDCDPVAAHLLSRALTAGVLCSPTLTEGERSTITWTYPGPVGKIVVDYGAGADVRGMTKVKSLMEQVHSEADVYGDTGSVQVMRFIGHQLLNNGTCDAPIMDVVSDLSYFYSVSEQIETDMYVSVGFNPDPQRPVHLCQGILLQAMPEADFEVLERLRKVLHSASFKQFLNTKTHSAEEVLESLLAQEENVPQYESHACNRPEFKCSCSHAKTQNILKTLTEADVKDIVVKGENVNVSCHFCSKVYSFTPQQVQQAVQ